MRAYLPRASAPMSLLFELILSQRDLTMDLSLPERLMTAFSFKFSEVKENVLA